MGRGRNRKEFKQKTSDLSAVPDKLVLASKVIPVPKVQHGFKINRQGNMFLFNGGRKKNGWREGQQFFRSLILSYQGKVLSTGFPKFFNYDETSPLAKQQVDFLVEAFKHQKPIIAENKVDGTLIIRSVIDGKVVYRTRGTFDGGRFKKPVRDFIDKNYPQLNDPDLASDDSILFEFISADIKNSLLKVDTSSLVFLDKINHANLQSSSRASKLEFASKNNLDVIDTYALNESSLSSLSNQVKKWENKEGLVVRFNNEQTMIKIKSKSYLDLHRLKNGLSDEKVINKIEQNNLGSGKEWEEHLENQGADHELVSTTKEVAEEYFANNKRAKERLEEMLDEIDLLAIQSGGVRKDVIAAIHNKYSNQEREAALLIFDGRESPAEEKLKEKFLKTSIE